jgi:hypothetical protein
MDPWILEGFNELLRSIPDISKKMLTQTLRRLDAIWTTQRNDGLAKPGPQLAELISVCDLEFLAEGLNQTVKTAGQRNECRQWSSCIRLRLHSAAFLRRSLQCQQ